MTMQVAKRLTADACEFVTLLSDEQKDLACLPLDDEVERRTWFYWPAARRGLPLGAMSGEQAKAAHCLVADVLSRMGVAKVHAIIALEQVLDEIENRQGSGRGLPRDPALYYLTIFGAPSEDDSWSLRFEGHHVSINVAVSGGEIACTPAFLGANPATLTHGTRVVTRPLGEEEDAGRELVTSLYRGQLTDALISDDAPDDILTTNLPKIDRLPAEGLSAGELGTKQLSLLEQLIAVYVGRLRPEVASREMTRIREDGLERLTFAWAGSLEPGQRHYYRVAGRTFLIEYDNTQDDANHIHAVWRDLERDFGGDVLRRHIAAAH